MSEKVRVLVVVEDEPDMRQLIRLLLSADPRIEIGGEASTAQEAIDLARTLGPGLVILDHAIEGDIMGLQAAPLIKDVAPAVKILLFSAYDLAVEARAERAVDAFVRKDAVKDLLPTAQRLLGLDPLPATKP